jgi:hypothetical protein
VSAGAGAAAGALSSSVFANHHIKIPLGIQLWTVKSEAEKDLEGTLRKLYALGFREIEQARKVSMPKDTLERAIKKDPFKDGFKNFRTVGELTQLYVE